MKNEIKVIAAALSLGVVVAVIGDTIVGTILLKDSADAGSGNDGMFTYYQQSDGSYRILSEIQNSPPGDTSTIYPYQVNSYPEPGQPGLSASQAYNHYQTAMSLYSGNIQSSWNSGSFYGEG